MHRLFRRGRYGRRYYRASKASISFGVVPHGASTWTGLRAAHWGCFCRCLTVEMGVWIPRPDLYSRILCDPLLHARNPALTRRQWCCCCTSALVFDTEAPHEGFDGSQRTKNPSPVVSQILAAPEVPSTSYRVVQWCFPVCWPVRDVHFLPNSTEEYIQMVDS